MKTCSGCSRRKMGRSLHNDKLLSTLVCTFKGMAFFAPDEQVACERFHPKENKELKK